MRQRTKETLKVRCGFEWIKPRSASLNSAVLPNVPEHKSMFTRQEQHVAVSEYSSEQLLSLCCLNSPWHFTCPQISSSHIVCCAVDGWRAENRMLVLKHLSLFHKTLLPWGLINQNKSHGHGWLVSWILYLVSEGKRTELILSTYDICYCWLNGEKNNLNMRVICTDPEDEQSRKRILQQGRKWGWCDRKCQMPQGPFLLCSLLLEKVLWICTVCLTPPSFLCSLQHLILAKVTL